jgi:hypothetical protein
MGLTLRLLPQDSHDMKKMRFSLVNSVSGDLQVLHVTYSTAAGDEGGDKIQEEELYQCIVAARFQLVFAGTFL